MANETFDAVAATIDGINIDWAGGGKGIPVRSYDGAVFRARRVRWWNGTQWQLIAVHHYDGTNWS